MQIGLNLGRTVFHMLPFVSFYTHFSLVMLIKGSLKPHLALYMQLFAETTQTYVCAVQCYYGFSDT